MGDPSRTLAEFDGPRYEWRITTGHDYANVVRWEPVGWRFERANMHLKELDRRIPKAVESWDGGHPTLRAPLSDPGAAEVVHPGPWYSWRYHEAHLREFTMLASETIHHIRAALDYIAYQLVLADTGRAGARTQFPIAETAPRFRRSAEHMVRGITPAHLALIESVQPYNGVTWTKTLNELSNRDKHRFPVDVVPSYQFETDSSRRFADPLGDQAFQGLQVDQARLGFCFAETRGPDSPGLDVMDALEDIVHGTGRLIDPIFREFGVGHITFIPGPSTLSPTRADSAFGTPSVSTNLER